jgi:NAD(P)-dependent dehydrogenase (short-subunit alcohol dehydrogenase family)
MDPYLDKKIVIIGGTSGIGLATAKLLVEGGARVLVTGRSQAGLASTQKALGKGSVAVSSDAGSLPDIDALASRVKTEFGTFDLLFVNAALGLFAPIENTTEAMYDEVFNVNVKGPFFAVKTLAPLMNRGGSIVLTTAISNVKGMPILAASGATKAALRSLARVFAAELLPRDIRVNAVSPGPTDTPSWSKAFPDEGVAAQVTAQTRETIPMKRFGTPEEVAKAVLFLGFDATFTTGAELPVDGGLTQL